MLSSTRAQSLLLESCRRAAQSVSTLLYPVQTHTDTGTNRCTTTCSNQSCRRMTQRLVYLSSSSSNNSNSMHTSPARQFTIYANGGTGIFRGPHPAGTDGLFSNEIRNKLFSLKQCETRLSLTPAPVSVCLSVPPSAPFNLSHLCLELNIVNLNRTVGCGWLNQHIVLIRILVVIMSICHITEN